MLQSKCSLNWRNEGGNFHYERDGYTVNNDTRAAAVKKDVEDSLRRMQTDYLDSVIVHYVCKSFRVEETVGAYLKSKKEELKTSIFSAGAFKAEVKKKSTGRKNIIGFED